MLKAIATVVIASVLFTLPIMFYISQADGGNNNSITVSEQLTAKDNTIIDGDLIQVSKITNGNTDSGGSSGGSNVDGSGENSGSSSSESNGGSSSENSGSSPSENSGGSSGNGNSEGSSGGDGKASGGISGVSSGGSYSEESGATEPYIIINKIYPRSDDKYGNGSIELYNKGETPANLNEWHITNATGDTIGMIHNKEIAPYGFLVIEVTGLIGDSQEVTLYDSWNKKMDSVGYVGAKFHNGLGYARIPDGADIWEWVKCNPRFSNQQGHSK